MHSTLAFEQIWSESKWRTQSNTHRFLLKTRFRQNRCICFRQMYLAQVVFQNQFSFWLNYLFHLSETDTSYFCWYVFTYIRLCAYSARKMYVLTANRNKCTAAYVQIRATCRYEYWYVQLQSGICFRTFLRPNNESGSIDLLHTFCQTPLEPSPGHDLGSLRLRRRGRRPRLESASESASIANEVLRTLMSHQVTGASLVHDADDKEVSPALETG